MTSVVNQSVFDLAELHRLTSAGKSRPESLRQAAVEFESMLYRQLLKSMRSVNELFAEDNPLSSQRTRFYEGMWDDQMAAVMARVQGAGLTDVIVRQLSSAPNQAPMMKKGLTSLMPAQAVGVIEKKTPLSPVSSRKQVQQPKQTSTLPESPESFVRWLLPVAQRVAAKTGLPAIGLIAQAALETGWGRHMLRDLFDRPSFNLFNIKADQRWSGPAVKKETIEFDGARMVKVPARFRVYENIEHAFEDLVSFFQSSPRYGQVWQAEKPEQYFEALQSAGYATDPKYAQKLKAVIQHPAIQQLAENLHRNTQD
ncbi:MAG: flagellar assembly peptidoglycan hydrolase FlgJ [Gammaproteobacteria bacterium]|nr:MAG: flagellar assembly peptidoglycan hydrolase FlgJ [Gammaproteobacteria bacterium]